MPLTAGSTKRRADTVGDSIKTFTDSSDNSLVQGIAVVDEDGAQAGVAANPLTVAVDDSTPVEVAVPDTDTAPLGATLRETDGTALGTSANPLPAGLYDAAGNRLGEQNNPVPVTLTSGGGGGVVVSQVVHKFGAVADLDAAQQATIWMGAGAGGLDLYPFNDTVEDWQLSSSDDSDNQSVTLEFLTTAFAVVTEVVTLTGQTPVSIPTGGLVLNRIYTTPGQASNPAGTMYLSLDGADTSSGVPDTPSEVRAVLVPLTSGTRLGFYCVPAGFVAYVVEISGFIRGTGEVVVLTRSSPGTSYRGRANFLGRDSEYGHRYTIGGDPTSSLGPLPAGTLIEGRFLSSANNSRCDINFDIALVEV